MKRTIPLFAMACLATLVLVADAWACPNCKDSLAANDPSGTGLVQGYFWSIMFMVSMPFTILVGMSTYFFLLVRRARRAAAAGHVAGGNPFAVEAVAANAFPTTEAVREEMLV